MKEGPILFSGPMVRAVLADTKTQTRRILTAEWLRCLDPEDEEDLPRILAQCPYGVPGDRLWVRETWAETWSGPDDVREVAFRATTPPGIVYLSGPGGVGWRPSIFLRRSDSRIDLEVVSVRVERLQGITDDDIRAEGAVVRIHNEPRFGGPMPVSSLDGKAYLGLRDLWAAGWDTINGKRAPWASNPWVWRVEFRRASP